MQSEKIQSPTHMDYLIWLLSLRYTANNAPLSEAQWTKLWVDSGMWMRRGTRSDEYCIAPIDRQKPLSSTNAIVMQCRGRLSPSSKGAASGKYTKSYRAFDIRDHWEFQRRKKARAEARKLKTKEQAIKAKSTQQ